jgi:hypothetical protein
LKIGIGSIIGERVDKHSQQELDAVNELMEDYE